MTASVIFLAVSFSCLRAFIEKTENDKEDDGEEDCQNGDELSED